MSSNVRQFPFHQLETISRRDAELYNRALGFAAGANTSDLAEDVSQRMSHALGRTSLQFDFASLVHHTKPPVADMTSWRAFVHHPDGGERALVVLDSSLADDWLRWALEDDEVRLGAPLSPRDWGALSYVGLEVLQALSQRGAKPLMLDTTPPVDEAVERYLARHRTMHEFCWIVSDRRSAGWLRIFAPARWLDTYLKGRGHAEFGLEEAVSSARLENVTTHFDVLLGSRSVRRSEVLALSRGDIVFPETHCLSEVDGLQTMPSVGVMRGASCHFEGFLSAEEAWKFQLTKSEPIPTERDEKMSEKNIEVDDELTASSEATESINISALHHAHVDVDIRVGRVEMSVAELARIQAGQILTLDRKVGDLVDILVDGELHGRGELVNVEGAVGVRVTSLER